jgi:hypothetical protein
MLESMSCQRESNPGINCCKNADTSELLIREPEKSTSLMDSPNSFECLRHPNLTHMQDEPA